jgi:hypothetical protein
MNTGTCRSCGAPLRWAVSAATGKAMPLNFEPSGDGNVVLRADGKAVVVTAAERGAYAGPFYTSHFATCPDARRFRRA